MLQLTEVEAETQRRATEGLHLKALVEVAGLCCPLQLNLHNFILRRANLEGCTFSSRRDGLAQFSLSRTIMWSAVVAFSLCEALSWILTSV